MRKCGLLSVCTMLFFTFFFSCLGEEGQKLSVSNQPGVVAKTRDSTKIMLRNGTVYADNYPQAVNDSDCVVITYNIDFGLNFNADTGRQNETFKVEVQRIDNVNRQGLCLIATEDDTLAVDGAEQLLNTLQPRYAIIRDHLFLYTENKTDSIRNAYTLYFDNDFDPAPAANGRKIYTLYLRAKKDQVVNFAEKIEVNAYNIKALLDKKGADTLHFDVKYVSSFNKDTTQVEYWRSVPFTYPTVNRSSAN